MLAKSTAAEQKLQWNLFNKEYIKTQREAGKFMKILSDKAVFAICLTALIVTCIIVTKSLDTLYLGIFYIFAFGK